MDISALKKNEAECQALRKKIEGMQVEMPAKTEVKPVDIDAQLFEYVASAGKDSGIVGIRDLDDAWVQKTFPDLSTMAELRARIDESLREELNIAWENLKFQRCADVLVETLNVEVTDAEIDEVIDDMRIGYEMQIHARRLTKEGYLAQEGITEEEFEAMLRQDVAFRLRQEQAFELCAFLLDVSVAEDEIGEYLACDDPAEFVAELKQAGKLEAAQKAAANVKAMRTLMETVSVVIA